MTEARLAEIEQSYQWFQSSSAPVVRELIAEVRRLQKLEAELRRYKDAEKARLLRHINSYTCSGVRTLLLLLCLLPSVCLGSEPETPGDRVMLPYGFWDRYAPPDPSDPLAMSSTRILFSPPLPLGRTHVAMTFRNGHWWVRQNGRWIVYHRGWLAYREGMFGGPPR